MALPIILIDSSTGSDSAASGAGPTTAVTGTAATTDVAGTTVTLDGSPDLSGVATDGSHVIYLADTTAGARNFGKITAVDNGAKTVTVADAFRGSIGAGESIDWAIGGKRASLLSTTSAKLIDNNSAAGDAMPGWKMRMSSGHTETRASTITPRRAGDFTSGRIVVEGVDGAATLPIITFSNNGNAFGFTNNNSHLWWFDNFEVQNTNATKTASVAFSTSNNTEIRISRIKCKDSTNKFWKGVLNGGGSGCEVDECDIENTASHAIDLSAVDKGFLISSVRIKSAGGNGINQSGSSASEGMRIEDCIITDCTTDGIGMTNTAATGAGYGPLISRCVIHNNGGDGIDLMASGGARVIRGLRIENCQITKNGGYGVNLNGQTEPAMQAARIRNNNFGNASDSTTNTSGTISTSGVGEDNLSVAASYTNTASDDYSAGTTIKALGFPTNNVGITSGTRTYIDIGMQRVEPTVVALPLINRGALIG